MRTILLAASALILASCTTPTMTAMNAGANPQQAAGPNKDEQPPPSAPLRRPLRTGGGWGGNAFGGMY